MNLYDATVPVLANKLGQIHTWLDKAVTFAEHKKFDPETLLQARLAPDQFPFIRQIQIACDNVKGLCARLAGKEVPVHQDTERTIAELRQRVSTVLELIKSYKREDFAGAEERAISLPFWQGKSMRGGDYLDHYALPNIYFHLTTAYSILRKNGVDLGKRDYMGTLPFKD